MIRAVVGLFAVAVLAGEGLLAAQGGRSPETQLKAAEQKAEIEGDYRAAIELYKKVAEGSNRALVAQAMLRMAEAYQKLGQPADAQQMHERLIREYPEQKQATEARRRMQPARAARSPVTRLAWSGPEANAEGGVSFDGRYLCYSDPEGDVAIRDLRRGTGRKLTRTATLRTLERGDPERRFMDYCVVSRDGRQVAYSVTDGRDFAELRVVGSDGRRDRRLYQSADTKSIQPYDWNADGTQIVLVAVRTPDSVIQIAIADLAGVLTVIKNLGSSWPEAIRFSPVAPLLAYDAGPDASGSHDVFVLQADGSSETPVSPTVANDWMLAWAPDGRNLLFGSDRASSPSIWSIGIVDGKPSGEARVVRRDTGYLRSLGSTRDGTLYHLILAPPTTDVYVATIDPATRKIASPPQRISDRFAGRTNLGDWAADGAAAAYIKRGVGPRLGFAFLEQGGGTVVLPPLPGTTEEREVPVPANVVSFRWSPRGDLLLAGVGAQASPWAVVRINGEFDRLPLEGITQPSWMPDGETILYIKGSRLFAYSLSARSERLVLETAAPQTITTAEASPDGQWIAVRIAAPDNTATIRIVGPDGGKTMDLAREWRGGAALAWTSDSQSVLISGADGNGRRAIWRATVAGSTPEFFASIDLTDYFGQPALRGLRLARDGRKLMFELGAAAGPPNEIWVLENAFAATPAR